MLPLLSLIDFRFQGSFIYSSVSHFYHSGIIYPVQVYVNLFILTEHTQKNFLIYEFTFCASDVMLYIMTGVGLCRKNHPVHVL